MIGFLDGIIDSVLEDRILLETNGIGYIVFINAKLIHKLSGQIGSKYKLLIHSITKEDGTILYGFSNESEKRLFCELIKISGVSGKIANNILSHIPINEINLAMIHKDETILVRVPGIGKKLATRIINELKGIPTPYQEAGNATNGGTENANEESKLTLLHSATSALVNLGTSKAIAYNIVEQVIASHPDANLQEVIKLSLSAQANH